MGDECDQYEGRVREICEGKVYDERQTTIWRARRGLPSLTERTPRQPRAVIAPKPPEKKKPLQLGDAVERALTAVGITSERVTAFLGRECGCAERKRKLNDLGEWASSFFAGVHKPIEDIIGPVKKKIDVAVVVTSHNYGKYLTECLMSVENQTQRPAEVIVVDDASDEWDTTKSVAIERGVKYLRVENRSVYRTRKAGLDATSSPFVVFLDADDSIEPTYLADCMVAMNHSEKTAIVTSSMAKFGEATGVISHAETNIEQRNWIHAGSMVRRLAIETTKAFDQSVPGTQSHADWYVWRTILRGGWHARKVNLPLYRYRIHGESMMRTKSGETYYDEASLATEPITLVLPLSGRAQYWPRLKAWVESQSRVTDILVIDTSSDDAFRDDVKTWLMSRDVRSIKYVNMPPSNGLADLDRRGLGNEYRGVQRAMPLIYEHMRSGVTTEFAMIVEDDVLPPTGSIDKLLRSMQPDVAAVSGVVMSRWSDKGHVIAFDDKRRIVNLSESTGGVEPVGGTGFGCLLLRRSAMLAATPFHHGGITGNFDMEFAQCVRKLGWKWLIDWRLPCVHGEGSSSTPTDAK